jgi:HD-GYP domain-containing protein (c-di-GMP phosphodiesterase class II)
LDRANLKDLAVSYLLHDIGKMYIDDRILTKPGKLTAKEFEQIKQHTVLGFQMLRQMPFDSPRPPQVSLQLRFRSQPLDLEQDRHRAGRAS